MPFDWKRHAVIGAGFGLTVGATIVAAVGLLYWNSSRPRPWDATTIKGISTTVSQTFDLDEQRRQLTASGFTLVFILENTGGRDYTVPQNLRLFERSSKTGALEESNAKLDQSFVVPAREKAEVHTRIEYGCSTEDLESGKRTERDGGACFKDAFGDVTEFVGFDDNTHTRLNLPKPTYIGGNSDPVSTDNGVAPDHGKPWERYQACAQASKLVPVCRQKGIALEDAKATAGRQVRVAEPALDGHRGDAILAVDGGEGLTELM
jgi:hypothetical protein